jgi:hypothetical protein
MDATIGFPPYWCISGMPTSNLLLEIRCECFHHIKRGTQMSIRGYLMLLGLMLLLSCKSTPLPLPQSEKLSPAKVKEIAARIDRRHGDLSSEMAGGQGVLPLAG